MPDVRTKALSYLRDEKVRVLFAETVKPNLRPHTVGALVQGFNARYWIELEKGRWLCSCGSSTPCAHLAAVQIITGWPSAASKQATDEKAVV
ncbi:hypothetical protein [Nonomuraea sp. NPDC049028]|uniref:hypothetical protein n=1 Tax=Nonomuraea sp. NPDC049028 TaxID=3364348 RepID=UPI00371C7B51